MKTCPSCKKVLLKTNFYRGQGYCKTCSSKRSMKWFSSHRVRTAENARGWRAKEKLKVLSHYSIKTVPVCAHCGFTDIRALSIDHINNDGAEDRRKTKGFGTRFYTRLRKNGYPIGLQVLCMNCQFIKKQENNECKRTKNKKEELEK